MRAMVLKTGGQPLTAQDVPRPQPGPGEVLIRIRACAVCRTDLHITDGELEDPKLPLILGHEIIGMVVGHGPTAHRFAPNARGTSAACEDDGTPTPTATTTTQRATRSRLFKCGFRGWTKQGFLL